MHPEILRELSDQRGREMRAQARQASLARSMIQAMRRRRAPQHEADGFVIPAIPDYVDGSFRTGQAGSEAGRTPAGRHAA